MIAAALPHIGVLWRPHAVAAFFRTSLEPVWGRPLIVRDALPGVTTPGGLLTLVAVALATFGAIAASEASCGRPATASPSRTLAAAA